MVPVPGAEDVKADPDTAELLARRLRDGEITADELRDILAADQPQREGGVVQEQARRLIAEHSEPLDPVAWARLAAGLEWGQDPESASVMADHFDLPVDVCRDLLREALRERQEVDLRNVEDDLTNEEDT